MQNATSIGKTWRVVLGARGDSYNQTLENRRTGVTQAQTPNKASPRIGVSYLANENWSVFANLGKSFRANLGLSASGESFAPEQGSAREAGIKFESSNRQIGATIAFYDIDKRNVLTTDPANSSFSIAAGEVKSRGLDADFTGQITPSWRVNASFSAIDAKVKKDNVLAVGGPLLNIPKRNASILAMYETTLGSGAPISGKVGIGAGVTHSSARLGEAYTQAQANAGTPQFSLPAYTVAKLVASWRVSNTLRLSLDIENLFDKTYYLSSFQRTWAAPGHARSAVLGMQLKF